MWTRTASCQGGCLNGSGRWMPQDKHSVSSFAPRLMFRRKRNDCSGCLASGNALGLWLHYPQPNTRAKPWSPTSAIGMVFLPDGPPQRLCFSKTGKGLVFRGQVYSWPKAICGLYGYRRKSPGLSQSLLLPASPSQNHKEDSQVDTKEGTSAFP